MEAKAVSEGGASVERIGVGESESARRAVGEALRRVVELCASMPRLIEDLRLEAGLGRSEAYRHVAEAIELELIERHAIIKGLPALLAATAAGHRLAGSGLSPQRVSPGSVHRWLVCSRVAAELGAHYPGVELIAEAELRRRELLTKEAIASAKVGQMPDGRPRLHRPDLVLLPEGKLPTAVEVELTPKAPERLSAIMAGWRRAGASTGCSTSARLARRTVRLRRR